MRVTHTVYAQLSLWFLSVLHILMQLQVPAQGCHLCDETLNGPLRESITPRPLHSNIAQQTKSQGSGRLGLTHVDPCVLCTKQVLCVSALKCKAA